MVRVGAGAVAVSPSRRPVGRAGPALSSPEAGQAHEQEDNRERGNGEFVAGHPPTVTDDNEAAQRGVMGCHSGSSAGSPISTQQSRGRRQASSAGTRPPPSPSMTPVR